MKKTHIRLVEKKEYSRGFTGLCGAKDEDGHYLEALSFASMPNENRCEECKKTLREMLDQPSSL